MNISSKLKKIITFLLVGIIVFNGVNPVYAAYAGEWDDGKYHVEYEDFSKVPSYSADNLTYNGGISDNNTMYFNLRQQYGYYWALDSGFYLSQPFNYYTRFNEPGSLYLSFKSDGDPVRKMLMKSTFDQISISNFVTSSNIDMNNYDVYYMFRQGTHTTREYGYLFLDYWFVPKGNRIAMSNQNKPEDATNLTELYYGLNLDSKSDNYKQYWHVCFRYNPEPSTGNVKIYEQGFAKSSFYDFTGWAHEQTIATNIAIFRTKAGAESYIENGDSTAAINKISEPSGGSDEKVGADAFYWDDLTCRLVRVGDSYRFVFDYKYSASDMSANIEDYMMNVDYTQVYKYKVAGKSTILDDKYNTKSTALTIGSSPGTITDNVSTFIPEAYGAGAGFILVCDEYLHILLGDNRDYTSVSFLNSYITVYVELVHVLDGGNGLKIKDKVSSDIRSFTFDALTLKSLDDMSDIEPVEDDVDVKTKDTVDSDGKVIDRTVESVTVNNNTTYVTNNYYYDSDGNKSTSSGSSLGDSLSDIASGLIKFIKTLVTEGLPAALEILKTLIKSVSDLVGFAFDQIGDIGSGTQNGIITVLKAIPAPLWGICSVGIIAYVIVGVVKKFF